MKRNISSKRTLPTKIFNFVVAILPLVALPAAYRELEQDTLPIKSLVISMFFIWPLFFLFINYRLKFVSVDENNLYVSRLLKERVIPLADIENVRLTTIGLVWVQIDFKANTAFGKRIFFMPTVTKLFAAPFQRSHPIVDELNALANKAS